MEKRSLRPCQAPEPPHSVDHTVHEKLLDRPHRREVCLNLVQEVLEGVRVLSREDDVTDKEPVTERVQAHGRFPLPRLWSRGMASIHPVCGGLSFARHDSRLPLISSHWTGSTQPLLKSVITKKQKHKIPTGCPFGALALSRSVFAMMMGPHLKSHAQYDTVIYTRQV